MEGKPLREVTIKIGLERLDTQEGITVEALLDSRATGLVMSLEFARKKGFKLKKLERPMQERNVDGSFNREGPIENLDYGVLAMVSPRLLPTSVSLLHRSPSFLHVLYSIH